MAAAQPRCVYCGAELPAGAVEKAAEARAVLEAEWARESGAVPPRPLAPAARSSPRAPAGPAPAPPAREAPAVPRLLLVLELEGADARALARALRLPRFEAQQRLRRGGSQLHRILPVAEAEAEAARLREQGLPVVTVAEEEVRRAEPVLVTRGGPQAGGLALDGDQGPVRLEPADVFLVVRGFIAREYQTSAQVRHVRVASLDPGYRMHLHRRSDPRPVELDPAAFDFGRDGAPGGAQLEIAGWIDRLFAEALRDDSFRLVMPALAPAAPAAGGSAAAAEALARRSGRETRAVFDNLAQFRFHSAWRAAIHRLRAR